MFAYYLHRPRTSGTDVARAVVEALPGASVVSPAPRPLGWRLPWATVADDTADAWRAWLAENRPDLAVVDGPAEHVGTARSLVRQVAVVARPGGLGDGTDGTAFAAADLILAPWAPVEDAWPTAWRERTVHLGALGWAARTAGAGMPPAGARSATWSCVVLSPANGGLGPRERRDLVADSPEWRWWFAPERDALDPDGPIWDRLLRADVVACAPTQANIAAAAATRTSAVLVLPGRPTSEQLFLADLAERTGAALSTSMPATSARWRTLLGTARTLRPQAWQAWDPEPGLARLRSAAGATAPFAAPGEERSLARA